MSINYWVTTSDSHNATGSTQLILFFPDCQNSFISKSLIILDHLVIFPASLQLCAASIISEQISLELWKHFIFLFLALYKAALMFL